MAKPIKDYSSSVAAFLCLLSDCISMTVFETKSEWIFFIKMLAG